LQNEDYQNTINTEVKKVAKYTKHILVILPGRFVAN